MNSQAATSSITQRNSTHSPLLRLPGEIRNKIYTYAIGGYTIYTPYPYGRRLLSRDAPKARLEYPPVSSLLSLTHVCRQTHFETRLYVFQMNEFYLGRVWTFINFLAKLDLEQRAALEVISLRASALWWVGCHKKALRKAVMSLTGLKRVFVETSCCQRGNDGWREREIDMVCQFFRREDLEIVFR